MDGQNYVQYGPSKDKVLWEYRTAAAAMRRGEYDLARRMLDDSLTSLGGIIANEASAKKARSYFSSETKKTFLGEPYERVMAYYYRGILYWMSGEPDNARACFRSAQIMDSDTENKDYASDYVLLDYLDGLASEKLGGDGADAYKRAKAEARIAIPPTYQPDANVLFFVDFGQGPEKYATGAYAQELRFRGGVSRARTALIQVAQYHVEVAPYDDLYFQATTRGGRVMDHILANKAVFKSATSDVGDAALISGAVLAGGTRETEAGLALLAAGLISKIVSSSTVPDADIRTWDNLPLYLTFAAVKLPPGEHQATIQFLDANHQVIQNETKTLAFNVPDNSVDNVFYVSDRSVTPQNL